MKISNNLALHLKQLQKEEQTKPKVGRRKEIIKMRAEVKEIEMKKKMNYILLRKKRFKKHGMLRAG